jgi:hypothetical protein
MKEDITQSAVRIKKLRKIEVKCSSIPKIISFSCSKCGKILSIEETFCAVDPDKKVKNSRFEEAVFWAFFCTDCLSLKKE